MITSEQNKSVKRIVALQKKQKNRYKDQCFVVEGLKMVTETPANLVETVFISEDLYNDQPDLVANHPYEVVRTQVFRKMSDTQTPQGIMAIVKMPTYEMATTFTGEGTVILLEGLQDPGNLGTILRTAEAIGVKGVICTKNTVDLYHPKVLRSTMGAIYHLPVFTNVNGLAAVEGLKSSGYKLFAAHLSDSQYHYDTDLKGGTCFMIGNEGNGLSDEMTNQADQLIKLPMIGRAESLNAAVAASVLMYEADRQRKQQ